MGMYLCNSPKSQSIVIFMILGVLRGDSASWSSDSPSRIADLVAGSRLDSTSPDMDSASLRCLAKTLTVQVWNVYNALYAVIVRLLVD